MNLKKNKTIFHSVYTNRHFLSLTLENKQEKKKQNKKEINSLVHTYAHNILLIKRRIIWKVILPAWGTW